VCTVTAGVSNRVDWVISEGHSSYADMLFNLGIPGLVLAILMIVSCLVVALCRASGPEPRASRWVAAMVLAIAIHGTQESVLLDNAFITFVAMAVFGLAAVGPAAAPLSGRRS
ncbi:MAG: hypothetical protein K2X91_14315, partial [Thermoleophilia bacterium]|nr:hypothetical protein [Thermoleophilia bacterium]